MIKSAVIEVSSYVGKKLCYEKAAAKLNNIIQQKGISKDDILKIDVDIHQGVNAAYNCTMVIIWWSDSK